MNDDTLSAKDSVTPQPSATPVPSAPTDALRGKMDDRPIPEHLWQALDMVSKRDQTIDDLCSKIETLKSQNEELRSEAIDALCKLSNVKEQRDNFKTIAESAVATVKEQEERLRRSEAVVDIVKEVTLLTQDKYGHFSIVTKLQELTDKTTESLKAYDSACGKGSK